ncbi:MAG: DUF4169 family protein [Caulobacteraceae bacterium]|nr:DUF4169 family protein [Caulobacter sp.]
MAEPINLNHVRKARAKAETRVKAAENRARFGRPKAEREAAERTEDRAARRLEGHRREDGPD